MNKPYGSTVPERTGVWLARNFGIVIVSLVLAGIVVLGTIGIKSSSDAKKEFNVTHDFVKVWPQFTDDHPTQQEQMRELYQEGWTLYGWSHNSRVAVMVRKREE